MMNKLQEKAEVVGNELINSRCRLLTVSCSSIAGLVSPGQFVMLKVNNALSPLLRRPLSVFGASGGRMEFLYEVKGDGTRILSGVKKGDSLDIIGPLGHGFSLQPKAFSLQPILVAGGMGVAPLLFLAQKLSKLPAPRAQGSFVWRDPAASGETSQLPTLVLVGARTKKELLCLRRFRSIGCKVKVATDDGSEGFHGRVTELLDEILLTHSSQLPTIYACGPDAMLEALSVVAAKYEVPAQVSMEQFMGCGIGACMGCVVKTRHGYKRACHDGPVFNAGEIIWEDQKT